MTEISRDEVIAAGGDEEKIKKDSENTRYYRVDNSRKVVTGKCNGEFYVDEPGDIPHWVCSDCGYGRYTSLKPEHGRRE